MNKFLCAVATAIVTTVGMAASQPASVSPPAAPALPPHTEVFMTTRDGVKLAANLFLPEGKGPWPVVVERTPYLKDGGLIGAMGGVTRYTSHGYAFVLQDVRGKGHSEGFYAAFSDDIPDGYDTVEWIAKQPWCNQKIGITGASAMGITSNMAAIAAPPHLTAAYVIVAPQDRTAYEYPGGVLKEKDTVGWSRGQGETDEQIRRFYEGEVDNLLARRNDMSQGLRFIHIPIFNVGGWYDIFNAGNISNFIWLQNHGSDGARGKQKLYMGPFGHGPLSGDLAYPGADNMLATADQELRWWDYWLKGIDSGIMDEPPVHILMMASARKGAYSQKNRVMAFANWPPASREVRYYPTVEHSLTLTPPTAEAASVSYKFDPANPVPTVGGANLTFDRGPMDQRAIRPRQDYLRFETPVLSHDVAIAGHVSVEIYAATNTPDTDFMAKLVDIYPDGYEALVLDAPIRARYRNGRMPDQVKLMVPGTPEEMTIDMWNTAITFEAGHRIEFVITSSNSPRFEVNRNNGASPGDLSTPARIATNTIYMDKDHPTALVLPMIYPDDVK
jgi:predicted acyl esterase